MSGRKKWGQDNEDPSAESFPEFAEQPEAQSFGIDPVTNPVYEPPMVDADTSVKLLSLDLVNGKRIVLDVNTNKVYLVDPETVAYRLAEQRVPISQLAAAEQPYNWDQELSDLGIVDKGAALVYLARQGLVAKKPVDLKAILARGGFKEQ